MCGLCVLVSAVDFVAIVSASLLLSSSCRGFLGMRSVIVDTLSCSN